MSLHSVKPMLHIKVADVHYKLAEIIILAAIKEDLRRCLEIYEWSYLGKFRIKDISCLLTSFICRQSHHGQTLSRFIIVDGKGGWYRESFFTRMDTCLHGECNVDGASTFLSADLRSVGSSSRPGSGGSSNVEGNAACTPISRTKFK